MKASVSRLLNFLFLLFTLGVVLLIGFRGNDMEELVAALGSITPACFVLCFGCWCLYVLMNALGTWCFLNRQGVRLSLGGSIHSAIIGLYYCNVTPGASGGQPMEMYELSKRNVPVGYSGSAMAIRFVCFQVTLLVAGAVFWLCNRAFVAQHTQGIRWLVLLGYLVNCFSISGVLLMAVSRKATLWVIDKCIRVGTKLHLCKDPDASREKWQNHCESFISSFRMLMKNPLDLLLQVLIAFVQLIAQMLVIWCIYRSMGLSGASVIEIITVGILLYISASYTPLPGASGAQEGGFALFFRMLFPDAGLFVALLIWRFFTYYLTILAGVLLTTIGSIRGMIKKTETSAK